MSRPSPRNYRVYCHDHVKKVVDAQWIDAINDDEAIAKVACRYAGFDCELWEGQRLVVSQINFARRSA